MKGKKIELEIPDLDYYDVQSILHNMLWLESKGWKRKEVGYSDGERMDIFNDSEKYSLILYYKEEYDFKYYYEIKDGSYYCEKEFTSKYHSLDEALEKQKDEEQNEKQI